MTRLASIPVSLALFACGGGGDLLVGEPQEPDSGAAPDAVDLDSTSGDVPEAIAEVEIPPDPLPDPSPGCIHDGDCDDADECTTDLCDVATGSCLYSGITCDDGDPCTVDGCDPASGCTFSSLRAWYPDGDGDGYGRHAEPVCSLTRPDGHADNDGDCCDSDPDINPDHSAYHSAPYLCDPSPSAPPSYDYNCDGTAEIHWTDMGSCHLDSMGYRCSTDNGWINTTEVPDCGIGGMWLDDCDTGIGFCSMTSYLIFVQECR